MFRQDGMTCDILVISGGIGRYQSMASCSSTLPSVTLTRRPWYPRAPSPGLMAIELFSAVDAPWKNCLPTSCISKSAVSSHGECDRLTSMWENSSSEMTLSQPLSKKKPNLTQASSSALAHSFCFSVSSLVSRRNGEMSMHGRVEAVVIGVVMAMTGETRYELKKEEENIVGAPIDLRRVPDALARWWRC